MNGRIEEGNVTYPSGYKIFRVGDIVALRLKDDALLKFKRVKNRNLYPPTMQMDGTNWLMAAGAAEYNAGTISDWLKMYDDVLGVFAIAVDSDREIEMRLFNPKSDQRLGIRNDDDIPITPTRSPLNNATVVTHSWGETIIPAFKFKNPTEYTPVYVFVQAYGHTYYLVDTPYTERNPPPAYDQINVRVITGGAE